MRTLLLIWLAALSVTSTRAHDPYEITSVAYLYSNRIELFVEMEFPTGMKLAGQATAREVAVQTQFESALPHLRKLAGNFFNLTAGNNVVLPLATNVELGVEDHIRFRMEFTPTPHRPLRFTARGLGAESSENPHGISLTVLDMVNQKVLGQAALFAATPTAEFPPRLAEPVAVAPLPTAADPPAASPISPASSQPAAPTTATEPVAPTRMPNRLLALVTSVAVIFIVFAFFRLRG